MSDTSEAQYEVQEIVKHKNADGRSTQVRVRWKGYGPKGDTWHLLPDFLVDCPEKVQEYLTKINGQIIDRGGNQIIQQDGPQTHDSTGESPSQPIEAVDDSQEQNLTVENAPIQSVAHVQQEPDTHSEQHSLQQNLRR